MIYVIQKALLSSTKVYNLELAATRFGQYLRTLLYQQAREIRNKITASFILSKEKLDLSHWPALMLPILRPQIVKAWEQGIRDSAKQLGTSMGHGSLNVRRLRLEMLQGIDESILTYCTTLTTRIQDDINLLVKGLRKDLKKGKISGSDVKIALNKHLEDKTLSHKRVQASSEHLQHSAIQQGKLLVAQQSDSVTGKKWKTNFTSTTCKICASLDGKIVAMDEPFIVLSDGTVINLPGLHPHCRCSWESVIGKVPVKKKAYDMKILERYAI